jgi:putative endopeptidase
LIRPTALAALVLSIAACRPAPPKPAEAAPVLPPLDELALDRSVSPCDDFYVFACGGWMARTEIPADKPAWSRGFYELREQNARDLRAIAEGMAAGRRDPNDRFSQKVGEFYASCMDEAAVEASGLAELRAEWARIDAVNDRAELADEIARLDAVGIGVPFRFTSDQDAKDATQVIGTLVQGGLSLPDRDYYLSTDEKNAAIRKAYRDHLETMLGLAGVPGPEAGAEATAILDLERRIAETHWTRVEMRDPSRIYNRVDRPGLEKLAPGFPWGRWLEGLGHPGITAVSVTTPRSVEKIGQLFATAPLESWRAYLRWHLLRAMAGHRALPKAFVDASFAFNSTNFTGAKELEPRWKKCVAETDEALGEAIGQAYVRRFFGPQGKERTTRLVSEIERAMGADLEALPWMDAATQRQAHAKLGKVVNKIGYPDRWRDYSTLKVNRESYFRNLLSAGRFEENRKLSKIGKPVDRQEWLMSPPAVNAYYDPQMNEMVFPAGILQPPFWNRRAPEAVNYGSVGMVVGHELTHGFDDQGRQFDAGGNLRDWWTPAVAREFDARTACLVDQFSAYEPVPGVKLNGKLTLGENIADLGGLKLAFAAMQSARVGKPDGGEKVLGFTPEQQFFVGFAQAWCTRQREPYARMLAAIDPHSPPKFRVNGPLTNLPAFAHAFSCPEGSPMVSPPARRCEVW